MKSFLEKAGLSELANRLEDLKDSYDLKDISLEAFGSLERGLVALSVGFKDTLVSSQHIYAEAASMIRTTAFTNASENELFDLIAFLKQAYAIAYDDPLKNWINSCLCSAKLALKEKL